MHAKPCRARLGDCTNELGRETGSVCGGWTWKFAIGARVPWRMPSSELHVGTPAAHRRCAATW